MPRDRARHARGRGVALWLQSERNSAPFPSPIFTKGTPLCHEPTIRGQDRGAHARGHDVMLPGLDMVAGNDGHPHRGWNNHEEFLEAQG